MNEKGKWELFYNNYDQGHPTKLVIQILQQFYRVSIRSCFADVEIECQSYLYSGKRAHFRTHVGGNPKPPNFPLNLPILKKVGYELIIKFIIIYVIF